MTEATGQLGVSEVGKWGEDQEEMGMQGSKLSSSCDRFLGVVRSGHVGAGSG